MAAHWSPNANMPLRGERVCPTFDPFSPTSILRFFADLEALFGRANVTDETDMKRHATYYSHAQV